jgi:signal transduction histidine kinase/ligand-binding sensor domain-containing protein
VRCDFKKQGHGDRRPQEQQREAGPTGGEHGKEPLHLANGAPCKDHGVPYMTVAEGAPFGRSARIRRMVGSELGLPGVHRLRRIVPWVLAILCCGPLWSQESALTLEQLNHRAFRVSDGAPAPVQALAQTRDGTLWVGSGMGLFRFDGTGFVRYPGASDDPLPSMNVAALISSPDGGLWIGFRFGGICLLHDGKVSRYGVRDGIPRGTVKRFAWDREGALWVAATGGIARIRGAHVETVSSDLFGTASSAINSMVIDRTGNVWVSTNSAVVLRKVDESRFHVAAALGNGHNGSGQELAESPDGHVWFTQNRSVTRLDPSTDPPRNRSFQLPEIFRGLFFDSEGNAWFSTEAGVGRWRSLQLLADMQSDATTAHVETMQTGLASLVFLEDREHNMWTGNQFGMDQFSRGVVVRSLKRCFGDGNNLAAGDDGSLWATCYEQPAGIGRLFELRNGQVVSERSVPDFTAAYRDQSGTVWFAGPTVLAHLEGDSIGTSPIPEQVRGSDVQTLARDAHGALWVSVVQHAVYRVSEGEWVAYGGLDAMPRGPAITESVDGRGGIWFGYPDNHIAHLRDNRVEVYGPADGVEVGNITALSVTGDQVWAGGDFGLVRFSGGRFVRIAREPGCALDGASGIVGLGNGDLWVHAVDGITHLSHQEVERAIREPTYRVRCEVFDHLDGIPAPPDQVRPSPSAVATSDGRVWFETRQGTISIDATHLVRNTLVPPVTIWSIDSAGQRYTNRGVAIHFRAHTTKLQIDYSAGSYTVPERVRFRYKLEGSDPDWQDGGALREAIYTNLSPGNYRFRVIASNSDGIWNTTGAAIDFAIAPAFYQTKWFYALCALAGFGVLAILYRLRIEQVRAQTSRLLAARLGERERIARELHDTLLQSMQGLIWKFQAATDRIPPCEPARKLMEQSLDRADKLLGEGRDRVKDLRAAESDCSHLCEALAAEGEQLAVEQPAEFRLSVEGVPRDLHQIAREETFLIAREALGNAFRHAAAKHIEVDVSYSESSLRVRVRDDGRGVSTDVLAGGKPNHFGLVGMRERAEKLDAQLVVWSRPGAGTEVDLRIPAKVAFRGAARLLRFAWWRRRVRDARDQSSSEVVR